MSTKKNNNQNTNSEKSENSKKATESVIVEIQQQLEDLKKIREDLKKKNLL